MQYLGIYYVFTMYLLCIYYVFTMYLLRIQARGSTWRGFNQLRWRCRDSVGLPWQRARSCQPSNPVFSTLPASTHPLQRGEYKADSTLDCQVFESSFVDAILVHTYLKPGTIGVLWQFFSQRFVQVRDSCVCVSGSPMVLTLKYPS